MSKVVSSLKLEGKTLFLIPEADEKILKSSSNIPGASVQVASDLNTYDVLNANQLVVVEGALAKIEELLK